MAYKEAKLYVRDSGLGAGDTIASTTSTTAWTKGWSGGDAEETLQTHGKLALQLVLPEDVFTCIVQNDFPHAASEQLS